MKYITEFRNRAAVRKLIEEIRLETCGFKAERIRLMEVCGTHTMAIGKYGLRRILPEKIKLLSGPGCPVCVTPDSYIDTAIELSRMKNAVIATFGDMVRVPGSLSSLEREKAEGGRIEIIYSPLESVEIAERDPGKNVILLGIGFETTAPAVALAIRRAQERGIRNFCVLSGHKLIPPAMAALLEDKDVRIDGFLCPGHVSAVIGARPYGFIPERYGIPCVIGGFEPVDILQSILMLAGKIAGDGKPSVEIEYGRVVRTAGNRKAAEIIDDVFCRVDSEWRGMGCIKESGLAIRKEYADFDAERRFPVNLGKKKRGTGCICGEILKGKKTPDECRLFGKSCNPENPLGPCMVSSEGTCAAYYKYEGRDEK